MKTRFLRFAGVKSRARRASTVGLFLTLFASATGADVQGKPEQQRGGPGRPPSVTSAAAAKSPMSAPSPSVSGATRPA